MSNTNPNEIDDFKMDIAKAVLAGLKPADSQSASKPKWTEMLQTLMPAVLLLIAGIGGWVNMSSQIQTIATTQINRSQDIATNKADILAVQAKQTNDEQQLAVIVSQNSASGEDRKDLREKLAQTNANVSDIGNRLTRIEAGVQQLLEQRKNK